jgi:predicted metal-dependent phosphoesterase TrpH
LVLRIDFHVHTCYSSDGITTLREVVAYSKRRGLDGVAITDHNTVDGAQKLLGRTDLIIIPGVEVDALEGHVLALNVDNPIAPNLPLCKTVQRIHAAGGIAVAAHPFAPPNFTSWTNVTSDFDAIEVINATATPFSLSTHQSRKLAARLNLPQIAGSDAHYGPEIGYAYTLVKADSDVDDIVNSIKKGAVAPFGKAIPYSLRLRRISLNLKKRFR